VKHFGNHSRACLYLDQMWFQKQPWGGQCYVAFMTRILYWKYITSNNYLILNASWTLKHYTTDLKKPSIIQKFSTKSVDLFCFLKSKNKCDCIAGATLCWYKKQFHIVIIIPSLQTKTANEVSDSLNFKVVESTMKNVKIYSYSLSPISQNQLIMKQGDLFLLLFIWAF
jgi:hypothetical protein